MLNIDVNVIIAQTVTFAIALVLLGRIVFKPASKFMRQRAERIASDLRQAAEQRQAMEQLKKDYHRQLAEIAAKNQEMIRQAIRDGQQARDAILAEARRQSDAILQRGLEQLEIERARVLREMRREIVELSAQLTEKVMRGAMTPALQNRMVDDLLRDLEAVK